MEIAELIRKQPVLFYFGLANLLAVFLMAGFAWFDHRELLGENVWKKPIKFALTTWILAWTFVVLFSLHPNIKLFNKVAWWVIVLLGIEVVLISVQAARGVRSHFNQATWYDGMIFSVMGLAITIHTVVVAVAAWQFFKWNGEGTVSAATLWGIRLGLVFFVLFSLEGFAMASRLAHTVGAADGGRGLALFNWSRTAGDLRVAHFFGIHAVQVLPIAGLLLGRFLPAPSLAITILFSATYGLFSLHLFIQAMRGKPFLPFLGNG